MSSCVCQASFLTATKTKALRHTTALFVFFSWLLVQAVKDLVAGDFFNPKGNFGYYIIIDGSDEHACGLDGYC